MLETILQDACPVCGRFIPMDKLMYWDKETKTAFHYACYQVYKERKQQTILSTQGEINDANSISR